MSLPSFCQTDTLNNASTVSTKEIVCIPKSVMIKVVKDLKEGDIAKEEVAVLNQQIELYNKYAEKSDLVIINLKNQVTNCQTSLTESLNIGSSYKLRLEKAERKSANKDVWIKSLAIAFGILVATNIIIQ